MAGSIVRLRCRIGFLAVVWLAWAQPACSDPTVAPLYGASLSFVPNSAEIVGLPYAPASGCDKSFIGAATWPAAVASPTFAVSLTSSAVIKDISLHTSSGNDALDKAALACAHEAIDGWSTLVNGKPAEATWILGFYWQNPGPHFAPPVPPGYLDTCNYPPIAKHLNIEGDVTVSFRIAIDGSVKNPQIAQSSDSAMLDQGSTDCLSTWHFWPVTQNGQPIEVDEMQEFHWRLVDDAGMSDAD
jgi:TonB family protein